ncbi:MAG: hypothetical protein WCK77_03665 [Verrucomicrobiota bacterium]
MNKTFDCVEMKNRIQQAMREEEERIGAKTAAERRHRWLADSDDPLASWWQSLAALPDANPARLMVRDELP